MTRTAITPAAILGSYPTLQPTAGTLTFAAAAADTGNQNSASFGGYNKLKVIALNTDTGGAHTVTITSKIDNFNRTGDITGYSVAACSGTTPGVAIFGPFERAGWQQSDGLLYFEANHATIKFIVVPLN